MEQERSFEGYDRRNRAGCAEGLDSQVDLLADVDLPNTGVVEALQCLGLVRVLDGCQVDSTVAARAEELDNAEDLGVAPQLRLEAGAWQVYRRALRAGPTDDGRQEV